MIIGKLRHYFQFESIVVDQDSDGATIETWVDTFGRKIPTDFMPSSGKEFVAADAVQSVLTGKLRVRYKPEFKPSMRGVYKGQYYNITAVVPDPTSQRYLILIYKNGADEG